MAERDCDGSEYCQADQHIEGCYMSPRPPDPEPLDVGPPAPGEGDDLANPEKEGLGC